MARDSSHAIAKLDQRRRTVEAQIKELEQEMAKARREKQQLDDDRQDDVTLRERLQLSLRTLEQSIEQDAAAIESDRKALASVEQQIVTKETHLTKTVVPTHQKLLAEESALKDR